MIINAALADWLLDRERQLRSQAAIHNFYSYWRGHLLFTELTRALDALAEPTATAVAEIAERAMANGELIEELVGRLLQATAEDPYFRPPYRALVNDIHSGLALFEDHRMTLALGVMSVDAIAAKKSDRSEPASIAFSGLMTSFRFLKAGGATLSFWKAPPIESGFSSHRSGRCEKVGERRIEDGETIRLDGRSECFVIEHASSDIVYLQAVIYAGRAPLAVEYDSASLAFAGASSTDDASSRTEMMVSLLRHMGRKDAGPLIEQLLESPHFYTRWHLMREYLALDAEAALPSLRRMADGDPHPEVRAAARQTLDLFFPDVAGKQEPSLCRA